MLDRNLPCPPCMSVAACCGDVALLGVHSYAGYSVGGVTPRHQLHALVPRAVAKRALEIRSWGSMEFKSA